MTVCNKCGFKVQKEDSFCVNCGNNLKKVCKVCGNPCADGDIYCEGCGNKLPVVVGDESVATVISHHFNKKIWPFVFVFLLVSIGGGITYYYSQQIISQEEKSYSKGGIEAPSKKEINNLVSEEKKNTVIYGVIKGNDIIVRSDASTMSPAIDYLYNGNKVKILNKKECADKDAAIINVPSMVIYLGEKGIILKKGQAVKIISQDGNNFKCQTEINGKTVFIYPKQQDIKKIYGEIWYQVQLDNKVGWIYGDYVEIIA